MFLLTTESTNPYFNLAVEEVLLKKRQEEFIILGINSRSVIIGKHQCPHREINTEFVAVNSIPVIRRITGGGTVYHDEGNLTFAFIRNSEQGKQVDFPKYTRPVTGFLETIGITTELSGSDIRVNGSKISGNAEHVYHNRVLHHGTLLFSADLDFLRGCLRSDISSYKTHAVASNPSHIINLSKIITRFRDINEFRSTLAEYFMNTIPDVRISGLAAEEKEEAEILAQSKYETWEWTFGYGPAYELNKDFRFRDREASCSISVSDGIIRKCILTGDRIPGNAGNDLEGCRHMPSDMLGILGRSGFTSRDIFNFF